jgi:hypothetical protein
LCSSGWSIGLPGFPVIQAIFLTRIADVLPAIAILTNLVPALAEPFSTTRLVNLKFLANG